jgi:putative transposase
MEHVSFSVSKDTPAVFFTSVTKDRLPVFRSALIKEVACRALDEARSSGRFLLLAYVFMPDHLHWITDSCLKPSQILRFVDGILAHRIIKFLKEHNYQRSLAKLREAEKIHGYKHSLWDHHPNALWLTSEAAFMQRVNYIHQNSVRAGLAERAEDYRWSSRRYWLGTPWDDEPVSVDFDSISWQKR